MNRTTKEVSDIAAELMTEQLRAGALPTAANRMLGFAMPGLSTKDLSALLEYAERIAAELHADHPGPDAEAELEPRPLQVGDEVAIDHTVLGVKSEFPGVITRASGGHVWVQIKVHGMLATFRRHRTEVRRPHAADECPETAK
jgi:hypothetical protein